MITQERLAEIIWEAENGYEVSGKDFLKVREYYLKMIRGLNRNIEMAHQELHRPLV